MKRNALLLGMIAPLLCAAGSSPLTQDRGASVDPALRQSSAPQRALVRLAPGADLPLVEGVTFGGRSGSVVSAFIEPSALDRLAAGAGVVGVQSDPRVFSHNDISQASTIGFRGAISAVSEVDTYTFEATAGQTVRVAAQAEAALDAFLSIPSEAASDDNSGPGSDADLTVTWATGGAKTIEVSGVGASTGAYLLTITSSTPILPAVLTGAELGTTSAYIGGTRTREARAIEGLDGSGVVIGIIDTGIDFNHADFRAVGGATRLLAIWDHTLTPQAGEHAPDVAGDGNGANDYGVEYTESEINGELTGATVGFVRHQDVGAHGSHVAGIAAGDGSSSPSGFVGAAPGARLIVVKHLGTVSRVVDGMSYVFQKAAELGYGSVVINLSLGTHDGPHDGTSAFDQAVIGAAASGRHVVSSVGNEGIKRYHGRRAVSSTYAFTFTPTVVAPFSGTTDHTLDFWMHGADTYNVTVTDGTDSLAAVSGTGPTFGPSGEKFIRINNRIDSPSNGATHIRITINDNALAPWTLTFTRAGFGGSGVVDGWIASQDGEFAPADIAANPDGSIPGTVSEPGTSPGAIAVGAYRQKFAWESDTAGRTAKADGIGASVSGNIAGFSSRGPTRDGRMKPDIAAPGAYVCSARSSHKTFPPAEFDMLDEDGVHAYLQGTSMAAPHVAGLVALLLEKNNLLELGHVQTAIASTALADGFTQPGPIWGSGKINAVGMLASVPRRVDIEASAGVCFKGPSGGAWGGMGLVLVALSLIPRRRWSRR